MKVRFIPAVLFIFSSLLFAGCGDSEITPIGEDGVPVVAVSIVPEQAFVQAVCGDLAEVVVMIPPGFSPESYEPTPKEMVKFSEADLYFTIGVPAEETSILPSTVERTKLVSLAEACSAEYSELEIDGGRDPHIWLSPKRAVVMVRTIAREMSEIDPENSSVYAANAEKHIKELEAADKEITETLAALKERSFIVFHPAFGYFAADYGLDMYALEEGGKSATASRLKDMVDFAKEQEIRVIFYQAEMDSSQAEAFAEEIEGRTVMLDPLSGDYINNLKLMARAIAEGVG